MAESLHEYYYLTILIYPLSFFSPFFFKNYCSTDTGAQESFKVIEWDCCKEGWK